ncbi:MAG TPA: hypothetical protein VGM56_32005 [Byssovorax sp.]|jgi:hypothetical protein
MSSPRQAHPALALAAYLEPITVGRRVVVLGDATLGLAEELLERGARLVHAYDPEPARVAEAVAASPGGAKSVAFAVLSGDLGVRDAAFDVVVVPDLSAFADAGEALLRAKRLVGGGVAVVSTPNAGAPRRLVSGGDEVRGAIGYYELYDLVSLRFSRVRMVGQAPFVGYTLADFAPDGEPEVSVDTSLLEASEEPEAFVAIASEHAVALDAYAVIGTPLEGVAEAAQEPEAETVRGHDRLALTEAQARLALVDAELETMRLRAREHAVELDARSSKEIALGARVMELEAELGAATTGRSAAAESMRRGDQAEAKAVEAEARAERLAAQLREIEEELRLQRERNVGIGKQLDEEKRARAAVDVELGMLRRAPEIHDVKIATDAELAFEQAQTLRPAPMASAATRDLEAALEAARRAAAGANAAREVAEAHARALAGDLDAAKAKLAGDIDAAKAQAAAADARARGEAERRGAADAALAARDAKITALKGELEHALAKLDVAHDRAAALEAQMSARAAHEAALEARLAVLEPAAKGPAGEAAASDVTALEQALAERGRRVRILEKDLAETERIGRELLAELAEREARVTPAAPTPVGAPPAARGGASSSNGVVEVDVAGAAPLEAKLDDLATAAARAEADLTAATWRITKLERELADARAGARPEPVVHAELEQALVAAHAEVASLRRALDLRAAPQ